MMAFRMITEPSASGTSIITVFSMDFWEREEEREGAREREKRGFVVPLTDALIACFLCVR